MATHDVVVVLPGIMGSVLAVDGKPVWSTSIGSITRAILSFGKSVERLTLPDGIGDDHPDDGVEPVSVMPDVQVIPGLWTPVKGYSRLVDSLRGWGYREVIDDPAAPPGNLVVVPYDWRLSNRHNGVRLAGIVEPALERWRAQGGEHADARLVFVCHSMGGLVAAWYLNRCDGWAHTRKLITFGTPTRGAVKALDQIANGNPAWLGRIGRRVTRVARSLPSLHQLLPDYACIASNGDLTRLDAAVVSDLSTAMTRDAADFHRQLRDASGDLGSDDRIHTFVGTRQTTLTTATVAGGTVTVRNDYQTDDLYGDGTVPIMGATPAGLPLDTNRTRRVADKHGNLHRNKSALDELADILTAPSFVPMGPEKGAALRVDVPELLPAGDDLTIQAHQPDSHEAIAIVLTHEGGHTQQQRPRVRRGTATARFPDMAPGIYTIEVTGVSPASKLSPVVSTTLVWETTQATMFDE